ncbi:hypothetical protein DO71_6033 [Burkholderia pseudomallei]|nr:hypothetical protein DO71_6033 [Burkholderia pseudomallei]
MSASLPFRRDLDCLSHSVHNSYRGHDRSFVSFTGHHGTRHRAFTDGIGLVLTAQSSREEYRLFGAHRAQAAHERAEAILDKPNVTRSAVHRGATHGKVGEGSRYGVCVRRYSQICGILLHS